MALGKWKDLGKTPGDSTAINDKKGVFVIHSTLLHTGAILMWSGHVEAAQYRAEAWLWDPDSPIDKAVRIPFPKGLDIFCCHHVQLPDGRILIAGGSMPHDKGKGDARGIKEICIFDSATNSIDEIGRMFEGRWYPTLVQLEDGSYVAFSGYTDADTSPRTVAESAEILHAPFQVTTKASYRTQKLFGGKRAFPTYPGMLMVPGGKIFHLGTNWQYNGKKSGGNVNTPVQTCSISINSKLNLAIWDDSHPNRLQKHREEGTFVLLPPAQEGKVLVVGGGHITNYDTIGDKDYNHASGADPRDAEFLDTRNPTLGWQKAGTTGKMHFPRVNCSAVILPNGKVLIIGGTSNFKWQKQDIGTGTNNGSIPSNTCEIYDPVANKFTKDADLNESRTYHSSAMLLPDGRVWVAGGVDPEGNVPDFNRKSMEFYEPAYFSMTRPEINNLENLEQDRSIRDIFLGEKFIIKTDSASLINNAAMIRPCSMTHHTDTQQRYVNLPITDRDSDWLEVQGPTDSSIAPYGYYMIWIIDNQGAPCKEAYWLQLLPAMVNFTPGSFTHNGKSFSINLNNTIPSLSIEGEKIQDVYYDEESQKWSHHISFAKFDTLNSLAEFLIENNAHLAHA